MLSRNMLSPSLHWRWKQYVPPTCPYLPTRLHTVTTEDNNLYEKFWSSYVILCYVKFELCFWTLWVQFLIACFCFTYMITSGQTFVSVYFKIHSFYKVVHAQVQWSTSMISRWTDHCIKVNFNCIYYVFYYKALKYLDLQ
jgi:hypothetical protein